MQNSEGYAKDVARHKSITTKKPRKKCIPEIGFQTLE